jgi:serine-type D-Ala-D-Ala endopeptidase (penicillin-binding protein 7)
MKRIFVVGFLSLLFPLQAVAAPSSALLDIYETRGDLQASFDAKKYQAIPESSAGFLIDLEDWARQYGWQEYPELTSYKPAVVPVKSIASPSVQPLLDVASYIVIDDASGAILAADHADAPWSVASLTKLVTAKVSLDQGADLLEIGAITSDDEVGGARLNVALGTTFTGQDLLYAALVASANNAAAAFADLCGLSREQFVKEMNNFEETLNLSRTIFIDPTGIETGNISTAREMAAIAREIFTDETVRKPTGSTNAHIEATDASGYTRDLKNSNRMLYESTYDDVYVTAGKTGYLDESGWNLVVRMYPMGGSTGKSITVVVFGSTDRASSFIDAHTLGKWAWKNFDWSMR